MEALNRSEKERAQWLSEDLYSISEPAAPSALKEMSFEARQGLREAVEAQQGHEWDRALTLLRQCREYLSPELLSYLRGSTWLEAGYPEIAAFFYRHALESHPGDAHYQTVYRQALAESDPAGAPTIGVSRP